MRYRKPCYYDEFKCIADKCKNTCCGGWEISIDDISLKKYAALTGDFSYEVKNSIDYMSCSFKQNENKKCKLLDDNGLCSLVLKYGDDYLCETCKNYPRHVEEYKDLRELSLSMTCEEALRIILEREEKVFILENVTDETDPLLNEFQDFNDTYFSKLEEKFDWIFELLQNREMSMDTRIEKLKENFSIEKMPDASESLDYLWELELVRNEWDEVLEIFEEYISAFETDKELNIKIDIKKEKWDLIRENILKTLIYQWYKGSIYSGESIEDSAIKIKLALFCLDTIENIAKAMVVVNGERLDMQLIEKIARQLFIEIEHSEENIICLEDMLW